MFSLDDRTGNAVTTVAVSMLVATILYLARCPPHFVSLASPRLPARPRGHLITTAFPVGAAGRVPLKPVADGLSRYF